MVDSKENYKFDLGVKELINDQVYSHLPLPLKDLSKVQDLDSIQRLKMWLIARTVQNKNIKNDHDHQNFLWCVILSL